MNEAVMQQELLAWRAFWQRTIGHINDPALADDAKLLEILHDAQDIAMTQEGGLADQLFKEYLRLKAGHSLLLHEGTPASGTPVITMARAEQGWQLRANYYQDGGWVYPGEWSHWFYLLAVPSHGPDGQALAAEQIHQALAGIEIQI